MELHGALEIVEAIEAERDRAPDRTSCIVDGHVDGAVFLEHGLDQAVAVGEVCIQRLDSVEVRHAPVLAIALAAACVCAGLVGIERGGACMKA